MATVIESQLINKLAGHFEAVDGIRTAYGFAQNPDSLNGSSLPAVTLFPQTVEMEPNAHYNVWSNNFSVRAVVFVAARQQQGGTLRYLENQTISLIPSIRRKFQTATVVKDILSLGLVKGFIRSIRYGAGGQILTWNGIEYIGLIVDFDMREVN